VRHNLNSCVEPDKNNDLDNVWSPMSAIELGRKTASERAKSRHLLGHQRRRRGNGACYFDCWISISLWQTL